MKVDIISDIHLENNITINISGILPLESTTLIIAGDITRVETHWLQLKAFLKSASKHYQKIIYVLGNHEFYALNKTLTTKEIKEKFYKLENKIPQLIILESDSIILEKEKVVIFGSILFSMLLNKRELNIPINLTENSHTRPINYDQWNNIHNMALKALDNAIAFSKSIGYRLIVVTHYAPVFKEALAPKYYGHSNNDLYCTDLRGYFPFVDCWIFGHTGYNCDLKIDNCRVLSNQYTTKHGPVYNKHHYEI